MLTSIISITLYSTIFCLVTARNNSKLTITAYSTIVCLTAVFTYLEPAPQELETNHAPADRPARVLVVLPVRYSNARSVPSYKREHDKVRKKIRKEFGKINRGTQDLGYELHVYMPGCRWRGLDIF